MIFYFLTAFSYTLSTPLFHAQCLAARWWLKSGTGAMEPRPPTVIQGRSADNRKALLWAGSFPPPTVILV